MLEVAHLAAMLGIEDRRDVFTRAKDGLNIPASTQIEVIVRWVHMPDPQITPVLDMAIDFIPT